MKTADDNLKIQHVLYNPGSYSQSLQVYDEKGIVGSVESNHGSGDGRSAIGSTCSIYAKFANSITNDEDIYTANKFIKFDGEGFEPVYYSNGSKYRLVYMNGNPKFRVWYATKKDGTNWTSQTEMNNANIEDMDIYDNIEDIPANKVCTGIYIEMIDGYISRFTGSNNIIAIKLKIRETATIGKTYGMTQRTQVWTDKLDRDKYSVLHPENEYPTPTWDSGNLDYIKTEYDENGEMISGTHSGGQLWGNTVLVVGANLHGNIKAIDENETEKENYDLGKNENIVTYSVEPQLDGNNNIASQIENVTLKAEITLPQGLTYIPGSTEYGEPEITNNSNGSQTLIWYIYGVISGQAIEPIRFDAQIDNETPNETQYNTKFVISEVIPSNGVAKIGNSEIHFRTSNTTISVTNLSSHRLYKEVNLTTIENNTELKYTIVYENKTEDSVPDFQVLDILPYNGDSRGSRFSGDYTIGQINVTQTINNQVQNNSNLNLYTTNSEEVRNIDAKNTEIGTSSIWQTKQIGTTLNEKMTGIAIKGNIPRKNKIRNRNNNKNKWK